MYCTNCGKEIDDKAVICVHCGVPTARMAPVAPVYAPAPALQPKKVNGFGIAGFVIGILSIWLGAFFCITSIVGLILSIVGIVNRKKCTTVNGLAVAGLVLSIITLILWAIFWIIFFVAVGTGQIY